MKKERKLSFGQQFWFHYRMIGTGKFRVLAGDPDEIPEEYLEREEHWGRKENCAKCRKHRLPMGEFKNSLGYVGAVIVVFATALVAVAAIVTLVVLTK